MLVGSCFIVVINNNYDVTGVIFEMIVSRVVGHK